VNRDLSASTQWRMLAVVLGSVSLIGCAGESPSTLSPDRGVQPRADGVAPSLDQKVQPTPDHPAVVKDQLVSNCPAVVPGSYAGTCSGTGSLGGGAPVTVSGTITFDLVASGNDLVIQNGMLKGTLVIAFSIPIKGKVVCGHLEGSGTTTILGVGLAGTLTADWKNGAFDGTWTGADQAKTVTGNGTWTARSP
jgi:hypothetical protein